MEILYCVTGVIVGIVCAFIAGKISSSKGRTYGEGFVIGLVLGIIGVIIVVVLPKKKEALEEKESSEIFYGLSVVAGNKIKYSGPLNKMELDGSNIPDFIHQLHQSTPSAHLLVLPQMGMVIVVNSDREFLAFQFKSPMSKEAAAQFLSSMMSSKKVKMVEQFGAIELL